MATLTSALNTEFTPSVGDFNVQVTGGIAVLERKNSSGAQFAEVGKLENQAMICENPIAGAVYRFRQLSGTCAVQADQ